MGSITGTIGKEAITKPRKYIIDDYKNIAILKCCICSQKETPGSTSREYSMIFDLLDYDTERKF